jgi:hypothetical protein
MYNSFLTFKNHLKENIRDYKLNKKEKIGILKHVSYFEVNIFN